jgi:Family of unknown function (DUF5898)
MITTGNHWRLVGLLEKDVEEESVAASIASGVEDFHVIDYRINDAQDEFSPELARICSRIPDNSQAQAQENNGHPSRRLWAGRIVPSHASSESDNEIIKICRQSGKEIIDQLALFVAIAYNNLSACQTPRTILIGKDMPCRILQSNDSKGLQSRVVAFGTVKLQYLKLHKMVSHDIQLHVIHPLGLGDSGNVCLATSSSGASCCAVKFYHRPKGESVDPDEIVEAECEIWNKVYGKFKMVKKAFTLPIPERICLVMPYMEPIPEAERYAFLENGQVEAALRRFVEFVLFIEI